MSYLNGSMMLLSSESPLFNAIGINFPSIYASKRYILLSLDPSILAKSQLLSTFDAMEKGRSAPISLSRAQEIAQVIKTKFPDTTVSVEKGNKLSASAIKSALSSKTLETMNHDERWVPTAIKIEGLQHFHEIAKFLVDSKWIAQIDYAGLTQPFADVKERIATASRLTSTATDKQIHFIREKTKEDIHSIIDTCATISEKELFGSDIELSKPLSRRDLALAVFVSSMQKGYFTHIGERMPGLREKCFMPAETLRAIYAGVHTDFTGALMKDAQIPSLEAQREIIFTVIEEKLTERFGPEADHGIKASAKEMMQVLRRKLFATEYELRMMSHDSTGQLQFEPFQSVQEGLKGKLGEYTPKLGESTPYFTPSGWWDTESLDEAKQRFDKILADVSRTALL